jgi:hypothetical protein
MKLDEVQVREKVPTGPPGQSDARLRAESGHGPAMGWALDYEAGMVTARKGEHSLLIPTSNVAYMRPAVPVAVEAKKPGPKAA